MEVDREANVLGLEFFSFEEYAEFVTHFGGTLEILERVEDSASFQSSVPPNSLGSRVCRGALPLMGTAPVVGTLRRAIRFSKRGILPAAEREPPLFSSRSRDQSAGSRRLAGA